MKTWKYDFDNIQQEYGRKPPERKTTKCPAQKEMHKDMAKTPLFFFNEESGDG